MAEDDWFGVTPDLIAAELPGIFPDGFTATSIPSDAQVASMITTADTIVALRVTAVTGDDPVEDDPANAIAVRYIIEWVKSLVLRIAYSGRGIDVAAAAAKPYSDLAAQLLAEFVAEEEEENATAEWGSATVTRSS